MSGTGQEILSHFTSVPLGMVRTVEQKFDGDYRSEFEKPKGLWISVDGEDSWDAWCKSNDYGIGALRYRIHLTEPSKILFIRDYCALHDFTQMYGHEVDDRWHRTYIDWPEVSREHHGIVIAPYQWSCRMDERTRWYYGWDCASGCIWNADAVACVEAHREAA